MMKKNRKARPVVAMKYIKKNKRAIIYKMFIFVFYKNPSVLFCTQYKVCIFDGCHFIIQTNIIIILCLVVVNILIL